jgi:hypothetical protein
LSLISRFHSRKKQKLSNLSAHVQKVHFYHNQEEADARAENLLQGREAELTSRLEQLQQAKTRELTPYESKVNTINQITIKTPTPKCRLY